MSILEKLTKWILPSPKILLVLQPKSIELSPEQSQRLIRAVERQKRVEAAIAKGDKRPALRQEKVKLGHLIEILK